MDVVVRTNDANLVQCAVEQGGGLGEDMVGVMVGGHAPTMDQAMDIVRPAGNIVVLGLWDELLPVDSWKAILKDITMHWSLTHGIIDKRSDYELCLKWMASREVPAQDLITHILPLDDIQAAFELSADKSQGVVKVCVKP